MSAVFRRATLSSASGRRTTEGVFCLSWLSALALATVFNLIITGVAAWRAARFFDYMGLHATRRQLSRLGLFDEHGEDVDGPVPATTPTAAPPAGEPHP